MTIKSLLTALTAATLGLAALAPHAAEAGDFPSLHFIELHLEPIRSELESYVGRVSSAKRKDETIIGQASGKIAPENPEITATATPHSKDTCLTKQYLATGAVLFEDTCTRQWAINSTAVATHKPARRTCLRKEVSDDGIVIFRDTCTNEWAMNDSQHPTDPPR
jgi:hypothetical protein